MHLLDSGYLWAIFWGLMKSFGSFLFKGFKIRADSLKFAKMCSYYAKKSVNDPQWRRNTFSCSRSWALRDLEFAFDSLYISCNVQMHLGGEQIRYLGQYDRHTNSSTTLHCVSQFQLCSHSALLQISHMEALLHCHLACDRQQCVHNLWATKEMFFFGLCVLFLSCFHIIIDRCNGSTVFLH